jgi:tetratricopeptide (TPR) repeat protein
LYRKRNDRRYYDSNGQFTSFYGTIKVEISLWEKIWRKLSTKKERSRQSLFIPTEFTGIDIDEKGFVFASNIDNQGVQAVRRLNPSGEDVIKKGVKKNVGGDLMTGGMYIYSGPSKIVDVAYRDNGIYSILDSRRGRIFTYDSEGNLLYIFGGLGSQAGTFVAPVAIESLQNKILVLDATRAEILVFNATEYGTLINEAVALRFDGDEALAVEKWEKVLKLDENFEIANVGIGKAYLSKGDNEMAMKYLKLGMSREYYSIAYKRYRNEILKDNISYILTGIVIIAAGVMITKKVLRRRKNIQDDTDGGGLE